MTAILEHDPDYELLQQLKECPDFECLPLPQTWCKKYNLKTIYPESVAESKSHNYVNKFQNYNYPPIIIDEPQRDKDGKIILAPIAPPEDIPVEVTQKPFDPNNTNLVGLMALPWTSGNAATATESVSGVSAQ